VCVLDGFVSRLVLVARHRKFTRRKPSWERGVPLSRRIGLPIRTQCPARSMSLPRLKRGGYGTGARRQTNHKTQGERRDQHGYELGRVSSSKGYGRNPGAWLIHQDDPGIRSSPVVLRRLNNAER